jgi:N-acetylglutamate synthase-like GNAT family acetyltransferase
MTIRQLEQTDIPKLAELHDKYFKDQYQFDKLFENLLGSFIIESDDQIVCAGGVKTITESILVTNKDLDLSTKLEGLNQALQINEFICRKAGYNQLHAFLSDDVVWRAWLKKVGFRKCNSVAYYLSV